MITIVDEIIANKKRDKIEFMLMVSEAVNFAYVGSQPPAKRGQKSPGHESYKKWRRGKLNELYPENKVNIWDNLSKKKKSYKIN